MGSRTKTRPAVEALGQLGQVGHGLEGLLVPGQAHEAHLGVGDQPERGAHHADAGPQDGHEHRAPTASRWPSAGPSGVVTSRWSVGRWRVAS